MSHSHAQIHCCHWDLGRFEGVCGEAAGGVMCDRLLARGEGRWDSDADILVVMPFEGSSFE
jgi:hypothetical protein